MSLSERLREYQGQDSLEGKIRYLSGLSDVVIDGENEEREFTESVYVDIGNAQNHVISQLRLAAQVQLNDMQLGHGPADRLFDHVELSNDRRLLEYLFMNLKGIPKDITELVQASRKAITRVKISSLKSEIEMEDTLQGKLRKFDRFLNEIDEENINLVQAHLWIVDSLRDSNINEQLGAEDQEDLEKVMRILESECRDLNELRQLMSDCFKYFGVEM